MSNSMKTVLLLGLLTGLLLFVGDAIAGEAGLLSAFFFSLVMNFGAYWFSSKILLWSYRAREVTEAESPRLFSVVRRLATQAQLPMPKIYILPGNSSNAFATGRNPENAAVAATEGILETLSDDELEGVMAHELAHVLHRDILISTVVATLAGTITFLARMAMYTSMFGGGRSREDRNPVGEILLIILAPIAAMLIQFAVSRSREFLADEGGARISQKPLSLANALRKLEAEADQLPMANAGQTTAHLFIVNPLRGGAFLKLFSTHPPTEERIARLEEMAISGIR
jgi:heat shock protein HtpX